jgi:hypothetical protein
LEHCYQEALALIEGHKSLVIALAQALIDHPEQTFNSGEIDAVIALTLAREGLAQDRARRGG